MPDYTVDLVLRMRVRVDVRSDDPSTAVLQALKQTDPMLRVMVDRKAETSGMLQEFEVRETAFLGPTGKAVVKDKAGGRRAGVTMWELEDGQPPVQLL